MEFLFVIYINSDAFEAHSRAITQMYYDEEARLLITASKDKAIKFWKLPERWTSEEVEKFEETEIKVYYL